MKCCFILGCHNRETDLLPHLDIIKYGTIQDLLLIYSGTQHHLIPDNVQVVNIPEGQPGAMMAFIYGLREAINRKYDAVCYRNADDWMFRHDLTFNRFNLLRHYDLVGYSWYGARSLDELTMNELYVRTETYKNLDFDSIENYMRTYGKDINCEYFTAQTLKPKLNKFYRLSDRESPHGIGFMTDEPLDKRNNRWFYRDWQLITSHDPLQRWKFYKEIKDNIHYSPLLEKQKKFYQWMSLCKELEPVIKNIKTENKTLLYENKLFYLGEAAVQCRGLPGDFAEVGVFQGGSLKFLASLAVGKQIHAFDTFSGCPIDDLAEGKHKKGDYKVNINEVMNYVNKPNVIYHKGVFPETATGELFALVHIDADNYQTTIAALQFFWPKMVPGGQIVLDDYCWDDCPGINKAIFEMFDKKDIWVKPDSHQAIIRKERKSTKCHLRITRNFANK